MTRAAVVRKGVRIVAGVLLSASLLAGAGWYLWSWERHEAPASPREILVRIPVGSSPRAVADTLVAHGLLKRRAVFLWGARLAGLDRKLRAGLYLVPPDNSARELVERLVSGPIAMIRLTIPEGSAADEVGRIVAETFPVSAADFLDAADGHVRALMAAEDWLPDSWDVARFENAVLALPGPVERRLCEGYLLPETYHLAVGLGADALALVFVDAARSALEQESEAGPPDARAAGLGPHEILTLASIVEAETPLVEEMPRVAAVYLNRLRGGHRLEADPTVAFVTQKKGKRILYVDLEVQSDYNTYRNGGLPPGPIGNPGRRAIAAVLGPDPDPEVFFFVADGHGGHVFTKTLAEHEAAARRYRKLRDAGAP